MTAEDFSRHRRLEQRLTEVLGVEEAATLVEQLARGEPATKHDLEAVERMDALAAVLEGRLEGFGGRLEGVEGRLGATLHRELGAVRSDLAAQRRTFVLAQLGMLITLAALAFAALRIT